MNPEWGMVELDKLINTTVMRNGSSPPDGAVFTAAADYTASPDVEITKQAPVVERILVRPLAHEVDHELGEQEALEYLSTLGVLVRWVDSAEVEVAS